MPVLLNRAMLLRVLVTAFCLMCVLGGVLHFRAGSIVQFALRQAGCEYTAEENSFSYFPTRFEAKMVRFRQGREEATAIQAKIERIEVPFSLLPLLTGKLRLGEVILRGPRVEVIEGEEKSAGEGEGDPPDLRITSVRIYNGDFRYRRIYSASEAVISVHEINGEVGKIDVASEEPTEGRITARLERSGAVDLSVIAAYFADQPNVSVDLKIQGQALPELNAYFIPANGLELFGNLVTGHGRVSLRGDRIEAKVTAKYADFDVKLQATRERTRGEAFLSNLFRSLMVDEENIDEPSRDQKHGVHLKRKKESVISALIRGLRDAVLHIATT